MIIIPSFDIPHPDAAKSTRTLPTRDVLEEWERFGFHRLQLNEPVSRMDRPLNRRPTDDLLRDARAEVQVAGDIQSADDIESLVGSGAAFVVLGQRALDDPDWLVSSVATFPDLLLVATAARERRIRARGWLRTLPVDLRDLAAELSDLQLAGLVVSFPHDAPIEHPDLALLEDLTERMPYPILVSGGSPTLATLRDLEFRGIHGAIIDSGRLSESFDKQTLAGSFSD